MQKLVPDRITAVTHDDLIYALRGAYPEVWKRDPIDVELATYYAQCLEENGAKLQSLHCFALGNVKATASWDGLVTEYQCDETVTAAEAAHAKTLGPCELHPLPNGKVRVVVFPGHPWSRFRAFDTLTKAAETYLSLFKMPRYAQAALRARASDPVGFVEACAAGGYFTSPNVSAYATAVRSIAVRATPACASAISGNSLGLTPFDVDYIEQARAMWLTSERDRLAAEPFPHPDTETS